jgi:hypothetical protein
MTYNKENRIALWQVLPLKAVQQTLESVETIVELLEVGNPERNYTEQQWALESVKFDTQENGSLRIKSQNCRSLLNNNIDANIITAWRQRTSGTE